MKLFLLETFPPQNCSPFQFLVGKFFSPQICFLSPLINFIWKISESLMHNLNFVAFYSVVPEILMFLQKNGKFSASFLIFGLSIQFGYQNVRNELSHKNPTSNVDFPFSKVPQKIKTCNLKQLIFWQMFITLPILGGFSRSWCQNEQKWMPHDLLLFVSQLD